MRVGNEMRRPMAASVIVNTYNRARSLERLLPSLEHLTGVRFEVVIVNGPSTDDTDRVLDRYHGRVKIARCPTANLSRSRNIGIAAAAAEVVVFIDDDALPAEVTWLSQLVDVFERDGDGQVGASGGASIHRDTAWCEFEGGWTSDYAEQSFTERSRPLGEDPARWYRRTVGNNSAFRRSALVAIGGFDERFRYYLDEADVCLRLARSGYRTVYLENCPVRHYAAVSPLGQPFIRDRRLIAVSDTYFCLKNGNDRLPRRIFETLRRAPRKHFVRELRGLAEEGRISTAKVWRLRFDWLRGVVQGLVLGLLAPRATARLHASPVPLQPFGLQHPDRKLSICLLSRKIPPDPHAGGIGRYTYDLARGLHQLGHRVTVMTEHATPLQHHGLKFQIAGVPPGSPPKDLRRTPVLASNLGYAESVFARYRQLVADEGPFDVVHATNWGIDALGLAQRDTAPLVVMLVTPLERVISAEGWDVSLDLAANIHLDQWLVERATRVCAPSSGVRASYLARAGWDGRIIHRVPLGISRQPGHAGRRHPRRRILFVGRLERRKGIHVLLEVIPSLLDRHPDWQCDLVGDASLPAGPGETFESQFRQRHAGARWNDRVTFHGVVDEAALHSFYRDADLFVAPSLYESFGLIYLEAMQYGVPVIGCRVGGVPEVVQDEGCGLLVPANNPAALEVALERLVSDDALRHRLGARAVEMVEARGSYLSFAERMIAEYRAAIASRKTDHHAAVMESDTTSVPEAALTVLDQGSTPKGLGLAVRAGAAFEDGAGSEAADLVAAALGVSKHPEYYAMAVDIALTDGDDLRATDLAKRGFEATRDDSDACLLFAATLIHTSSGHPIGIAGWNDWWQQNADVWPARLLRGALGSIRAGHDRSAIVLLSASLTAVGAGGSALRLPFTWVRR